METSMAVPPNVKNAARKDPGTPLPRVEPKARESVSHRRLHAAALFITVKIGQAIKCSAMGGWIKKL